MLRGTWTEENLERDNIEYEVDYDFEEGMPGVLVTIEWED